MLGSRGIVPSCLTSGLDGDEGLASLPGHFNPGGNRPRNPLCWAHHSIRISNIEEDAIFLKISLSVCVGSLQLLILFSINSFLSAGLRNKVNKG
jgi:hypothetical protein